MSSHGMQHHHGVRKNIVEGIGGVVIGAAAVLLLTRLFQAKKRASPPSPSLPAPAHSNEKHEENSPSADQSDTDMDVEQPKAKSTARRSAATRKSPAKVQTAEAAESHIDLTKE